MAKNPLPIGPRGRLSGVAFYVVAVLLLLGGGGGTCAYLILTKPGPSGQTQEAAKRLVRVFAAEKTSHRLAISAYGITRASEVWTAIAEVKGRAVHVESRFEPGEILPAEMLLVRIDPVDYELALKRFEAEEAAKRVQLSELTQQKENFDDILQLQRRVLTLAQSERDRLEAAFSRNAASRSAFELAESAYEARRTAVQETLNKLALLPIQRELAQKQLAVAVALSEQARRDLSKCEIRLPLAARCVSKSVEPNQYVATAGRLGTFLALDTAEVVAMVETRKIPALFPGGIEELGTLDFTQLDLRESLWKRIQIPVEVSWGLGDRPSVWYGRVARIGSSLDPGTRTVQVIIEVPDPYKDVRPGIRPPLVPDVFCQVTAYGATLSDVVVIPRDALREGRVYLLREGTLHIQPITVLAMEEELAVISAGIESGDRVIVADLFPAVEGMPLRAELIENPVQPRREIDVPASVFEATARPEATP